MARNKPVLNPAPTSTPEARYLSVKAAAAYSGATVWAIRTLAWERRCPFLKIGTRILFDKADLDRYFESQKIKAA
jgi:excisionase family DNA binding protein